MDSNQSEQQGYTNVDNYYNQVSEEIIYRTITEAEVSIEEVKPTADTKTIRTIIMKKMLNGKEMIILRVNTASQNFKKRTT
jgi:hypothetical protein